MNKIFDIILGILCYTIGILLVFDKTRLENMDDPFALILILLGGILIRLSNKQEIF